MQIIVAGWKIFYFFKLWHRMKLSIEPENATMIFTTKVGHRARRIYKYVTTMGAYIGKAIDMTVFVVCKQQRFIDVLIEQGERITLSRFFDEASISNELPRLRKDLFLSLFKSLNVCVKIC